MKPQNDKQMMPQDLINGVKTKDYYSIAQTWWTRPIDLPPFTFLTIQAMLLEPTIRLGLATRIAPLDMMQFGTLADDGKTWTNRIKASSSEVEQYVRRTIKKIWSHISEIASAQTWGWSAGECVYEYDENTGCIELRKILQRHAVDCRALAKNGEIAGVRFMSVKNDHSGYVDLTFPQCIWHSHNPEPGAYYGRSINLGAYSPWADKWFEGGALAVRRTFFYSSAFSGVDLGYPPGYQDIDGVQVSNRDIARQIVEIIRSGGVTVRPSEQYASGGEKWPLTRASNSGTPTHILDYPKDCDREMNRGLEIPDEVIGDGAQAVWGGGERKIPMLTFLCSISRWGAHMFRDAKSQVLDKMVKINFGPKAWYYVEPIPLLNSFQQDDPSNQPAPQQDVGTSNISGQEPSDPDTDQPQLTTLSLADRIANETVDVAKAVASARNLFDAVRKQHAPKSLPVFSRRRAIDVKATKAKT